MFALQVVWFYLLMLIVPLAIGGLFFPERSVISPVSYLAGLATAWGTYEIIGLPCALLFKTSLTTLTVLWSAVMILLTIAGVLVRYTHGRMALLPAKGLQLSRTARILLTLVIVMVVLQTARTVTGYFLAFDDSDYLAQSTTALYTNTINQYEPQTGRQVDILDQIEPHHKIALWGIIWATMTQLTGIHPSILCRTLLPVIVIPAAYIIMYLILKDMFGGEEEKPLAGLLFLQIAYELGSCGGGVRQWWLLMYSWYGKTVTAMLICPFILYLFLILENETNKKHQLQLWVLLALTAWAGCMVAASSFLMVPFLLGVLGLCHFVRKRNLLFCIKLGICIIPCLALYYITR
ncbi:DUF6077 domain-containing protein [Gemmiger sp.]|uniref:DUF6077 domain-containing protein n=1 Tax=Gemmiger sp. TaxID=2049027 RepID=UPI003AB3C025